MSPLGLILFNCPGVFVGLDYSLVLKTGSQIVTKVSEEKRNSLHEAF